MTVIIIIEDKAKIYYLLKYIYLIRIQLKSLININLDLQEKKMDIKEALLILKDKNIQIVMKLIV